ncbi:hypothetical protein MF672_031150 [Actinomadura sp. ATCC 31491]|uniref:Uncharacterized protein n=1 Tax=Actinomadura luzonensis TaxID=2805427 RepID=A0ABT0G0X6_9ACTN|nr:hypothetical protein [Actinomadura luzonensis]
MTRHDRRSFRLDRLAQPRNTGAPFLPRPRTPSSCSFTHPPDTFAGWSANGARSNRPTPDHAPVPCRAAPAGGSACPVCAQVTGTGCRRCGGCRRRK